MPLIGQKVTYSDLVKLTGKTYRTVRGRLARADLDPISTDTKSQFYDSAAALEAIYTPQRSGPQGFDLQEQRARESAMKADVLQIDRDRKLQLLLDAKEVERTWLNVVAAVRSKIRAFPYKLVPKLSPIKDEQERLIVAKDGADELLQDLAASIKPEQWAEIEKSEDANS